VSMLWEVMVLVSLVMVALRWNYGSALDSKFRCALSKS
jgi:hypothetical protein